MKFNSYINRFDESYKTNHIVIPDEIYNKMILLAPDKRIICTINNEYTFHCAMLSKVTFYFVLLNKETCKKYNYQENDEVTVEIIPDKSKYGMPISEEFQEVLFSDPEGENWFEKLTDGKKRSLIYLTNKTKNPQLKIEKCFVVLEHLKRNKGTLDIELLNQDFKNFTNIKKL